MRITHFCLAMLFATPSLATLRIVTTTTDYADIAKQIGKDKVEVHSVMKGPENVHNVMAKPTEMVELNKADLFVHSGLDTEPWRDNLMKGERNPRIMNNQPGNVDRAMESSSRKFPPARSIVRKAMCTHMETPTTH